MASQRRVPWAPPVSVLLGGEHRPCSASCFLLSEEPADAAISSAGWSSAESWRCLHWTRGLGRVSKPPWGSASSCAARRAQSR